MNTIYCPNCKRKYSIDQKDEGKIFQCMECKTNFQAPITSIQTLPKDNPPKIITVLDIWGDINLVLAGVSFLIAFFYCMNSYSHDKIILSFPMIIWSASCGVSLIDATIAYAFSSIISLLYKISQNQERK